MLLRQYLPEVYLGACQTSMMEFLIKMVKALKALTCSELTMQKPEQCVKYVQS